MTRPRFLPDNFTLLLVAAVGLATWLPARGIGAQALEQITTVAIGLLFFLHGARLSRQAIVAGILHWRLHLLVVLFTFVLFPVLGLLMRPLLQRWLPPDLVTGFMYLCMLPATVQSAIAFTSMARGNVPAAVCSASASTLLGVFITPVLVAWIPGAHEASAPLLDSVAKIMLQLMLPFFAGHLAGPWVSPVLRRHPQVAAVVDRGSILLVVYTAFSAAVVQGLWQTLSPADLAILIGACVALLSAMLLLSTLTARAAGLSREDEITLVFCGSKKSLASGIPMARLLFASGAVGAIVLPVMVFHQIQLMVCAVLAQRYARRPPSPAVSVPEPGA